MHHPTMRCNNLGEHAKYLVTRLLKGAVGSNSEQAH